MIKRCGTVAGMRTDKGTRSIARKSDVAPLCASQIPHDLTWDRTHVAAVESQVLTVWSYDKPEMPCASKYTPIMGNIQQRIRGVIWSHTFSSSWWIMTKNITYDLRFPKRWLWRVLTIFWDITPCSPLKVNRRFGEHIATCHLLSRWFLTRLIIRPWRWRCTSEDAVDFQRITSIWRYITDDRTL
jgi:hypothetical protein